MSPAYACRVMGDEGTSDDRPRAAGRGLTRAALLRAALALPLGAALPASLVRSASITRMNTRPIPSSREELPVIGCGTYLGFDQTPGSSAYAQLPGVVEALLAAGGKVLDSSPMYGRAEQTTGELLAANGRRSEAFLATKVWVQGQQEGIRQMEESMRLLRSPQIDLMQVHNLVDWRTHLATLRGWKEQGRVRYVGITHYTASAYPEVERVLRAEKLDFLQINYALDDRLAEQRLLPLAAERGVAVIVNMPFGGGGLLRGLLPQAAARLGGRNRLHQLGPGAPEVRAQPSGGDLRHPRHAPARAHGRQRPGRLRRGAAAGVLERQGRGDRSLSAARAASSQGAAASAPARGRRTTNRLPRPSCAFMAPTLPPCASASARTTARPIPSPDSSSGTWVSMANRSKMPARTSGAMPGPSSATVTTTWWPSTRVASVTAPPAGERREALLSRLPNTWIRRCGSPFTSARLGRGLEQHQPLLLGVDRMAAGVGGDAEDRVEQEIAPLQPELAGADARAVEQVVDQPRDQPRLALHQLQLPLLRCRVDPRVQEQRGRHPDRRQRVAQGMRRHRHEVDLPMVRRLGVGLELLRDLRRADQLAVGLEQLAQPGLVLGEGDVGAADRQRHGLGAEVVAGVGAAVVLIELEAARPLPLDAVHGGIGMTDQRHRIGAVVGIDGDADARLQRDRVRADDRGRGQRVEDLAGDRRGVGGARHLGEQHHELVAAVAAHRVRLAHHRRQAFGGQAQHLVADGVAEGVVDLLEAVEVEEQQPDPRRAALRPDDRALQPVEHQHPGGGAGELVVLGRAGQLVEAADRGLRRGVGLHRRLHQPVVHLEQLRRAQAAQLLLRLLGLAAQAGEIGAHRLRLGLEQGQRASRGSELFLIGRVGHGAADHAPGRSARRQGYA